MKRLPQTDDVRVVRLRELESPSDLRNRLPLSENAATTVAWARNEIRGILTGKSTRSLVVLEGLVSPDGISPIHSIVELSRNFSESSLVVPLVPSKSRASHVSSSDANSMTALFENQRKRLLELNDAGLPGGAVLTDTISPQYFSDLLSWATVPMWATESQVHRELASGVSFAVCFAANDSSTLKLAADAVETAACPHHFVGLSKRGQVAMVTTAGNSDCTVRLSANEADVAEGFRHVEATEYLKSRGITNRPVLGMASGPRGFRGASASYGRLVHVDLSSLGSEGTEAKQLGVLETCLDLLSQRSVKKR